MTLLSLFLPPPPAPALSLDCHRQESQLSGVLSGQKLKPVTLLRPSSLQKKSVVFRSSNSSDPKESDFFDENGAVDDMDGYLNYLSLEYDSVWDTKPSWCQPWTIMVTGVLIITGSWLILHSILATTVVVSLIGAWWYIFLYSYPKAYTDMIAERRKKVTNGIEDTFGMTNSRSVRH